MFKFLIIWPFSLLHSDDFLIHLYANPKNHTNIKNFLKTVDIKQGMQKKLRKKHFKWVIEEKKVKVGLKHQTYRGGFIQI